MVERYTAYDEEVDPNGFFVDYKDYLALEVKLDQIRKAWTDWGNSTEMDSYYYEVFREILEAELGIGR